MDAQRARVDVAAHGPVQDAARLQADFAHVDVRIGLVADQDMRQFDHRGRDHGMKVQCDGDGQIRSDDFPQASQEFPFAILAEAGNHRAVQRQKDAVQRGPMLSRRVADEAGDMVERLARDGCAGRGMGRNGVRDLPTRLGTRIKEARQFVVHIAEAVDGGLPKVEHLIAEIPKRRLPLLEGVAFMDKSAGQNVEGHRDGPFKAGGNRPPGGSRHRQARGSGGGRDQRRADSVRQRRTPAAGRRGWESHP